MGKPAIQIEARDLARLHSALLKVDKRASRELTGRLRKMVVPYAEEVRRAALAIPSQNLGREQLGLRQGIAAAVEIKMGKASRGAYARIRVSGRKFVKASGRDNPRLPRYMEGLSKRSRWRHPVWADKGAGNGGWKGTWSAQDKHPFIMPTVAPHRDQIAKAMVNEYADTFDIVFREGGLY